MKILHVIATLGAGGAEAFVANLASEMSFSGNDVSVFLMAGIKGDRGNLLAQKLKDSRVKIIGSAERSAWSPINIVKLIFWVYKNKPDIIHAHLYSAEVLVAISKMFLFNFPKKYVRTLHNTEIIGSRNKYVVLMMDRFFDLSIACGESVSNSYKRIYKNNFKTSLIAINNGISSPEPSSFDKKSFKNKIKVSSDCFLILSVAGFRGASLESCQKAHDVMIYSFCDYLLVNPNAYIVFVGGGELLNDAKRLVEDLGISNKVRFVGVVSNPGPYFQAADIFFMPSRYEGLPISLLEAASYGLPIVASNIPEIRSLNDGYPWELRSPNQIKEFSEALNLLANYSISEIKRSEYAQSVINRFSISACSNQYISAYSGV